jgi:type II secretion system protein N
MFSMPISSVARSAKTTESAAQSSRVWGVAALIAGEAAAALMVLLAFTVATFPYQETISTMLAPYQLRIKYQDQRMSLPLGVRLENVTLESTDIERGESLLSSASVRLAPTIGSLIFGAPGMSIAAEIYGGSLNALILQESNAIKLDFQASAINLEQSEPLRRFGARLTGIASGNGNIEFDGPELTQDRGSARLQSQRLTIEVRQGFPRISLGAVSGAVALDSGKLTFQDVEAHGGDVEARADGSIRIADPIEESTISARLYLTPTQSGRDRFGLFFNMLPHPPSEGPYDLQGLITEPRIS